MKSQFIAPVITILDDSGNIDRQGNIKVYDHLLNGGITGMVILGSTGEFFGLSMEQQKELVDIATSHVNKRFKVLVGASFMNPDDSIELSDYAHEKGADGVMIISPYYFPLTDENVYNHYSHIAANVDANIYLYNFPDRTGYSLSPEITLKLASEFKNIVGFKDTILDTNHTCELIKTVKSKIPHFEVFSGFDNNFAHNIISGGDGCIGGLANLVPDVCANWMKALAGNNLDQVAEIQRYIDKLMPLYGIGVPFIPIMKKALQLRGMDISDKCTKPFLSATASQAAKIQELLDANGITKL